MSVTPAPPVRLRDVARLVDELLELIRSQTGFALVMVTRRLGEDWMVVQASTNTYGVVAGDTLRWSESICSRMVASGVPGPWLVPDVDEAGVGDAPVRRHKAIRAYAGVPLVDAGGAVMGTLCAIDPDGRPVGDSSLFAFAESFAGWALDCAPEAGRWERTTERALLADDGDGATLVPAMAWTRLLESEATRTRWTGERTSIALVRRTTAATEQRAHPARLAASLSAQLSADDAVTVLGSNRVGVLSIGRHPEDLRTLLNGVAEAEGGCGEPLAWVASELAGSEPAANVVDALETALVGDAAPGRAASQLIVYEFCAGCGLKGVYRRPGTEMLRCKYCRIVTS